MIDQQTVDRIIAASQIEEVVKEYVSLRKRGVNYIGLCPFHNEKTGSFTVSPAKGIYKCFGCGKGGNAVNFIMEIEQLSYVDALKFLAKKYNIEIVEKEVTPEELAQRNERESLMVATAYAQRYFTNILHKHTDGKNIGLSYFRERGFRDDIIEKFQLGYSLDQRDAFTHAALHDGYKLDVLVKTGFTIKRDDGTTFDRFFGRVMFPIHSVSGRVIAFGGRTLKIDKKIAKYQNSPESEIYHKSNVLYGIYFAKKTISQENKCFLVEGYTDVISLHQAGVENVVASSGTSLTVDQIKLIKRFTPNITILYDGDAAGIKASLRGTDMVLEEGLNLKIVLLPDGEDPDSYAKSHNANEVLDYIAKNETDFIKFKSKLLLDEAQNDPIKRAELITNIVGSISVIPESITRSVYIKECSKLLDIQEEVLYGEVAKHRRNRLEQVAQREAITERRQQLITPSLPSFVANVYCEEQEREILFFLIRYGNSPLFIQEIEGEKEPMVITVGQYIIEEIHNDDLELQNLVYKKFFDAYCQQLDNAPEIDNRIFLNHPDPEISQLAVDLLADKHELCSKLWEKRSNSLDDPDFLQRSVPKAIQVYKNKVLQMAIKKMMDDLGKLDKSQTEEINSLLQKITQLNTIKNEMSKDLERVVL